MVKKFLVGALAAVLMVEGAIVTTATSEAAKAPKAKYTYNFNKADKNVVAVTRKGDDASAGTNTGTVPKADKKKKVIYQKGKNGKGIYLDRTYGVQLKNMKLNAKEYTISYWVKSEKNMSNFMTTFFAGSDLVGEKAKWISITKTDWVGDSSPIVWNQDAVAGKMPWTGPWAGEANNVIAEGKGWNHITVVVGGTYKDKKNDIDIPKKTGFAIDNPEDANYIKDGTAPNVVIYVNGKMYGTGTSTNVSTVMDGKESAFLGINCWDALFKGWFDDIQIYDKALTQDQVKAVYKSVGGK